MNKILELYLCKNVVDIIIDYMTVDIKSVKLQFTKSMKMPPKYLKYLHICNCPHCYIYYENHEYIEIQRTIAKHTPGKNPNSIRSYL
jgi:hypothetical protein